MNQAVAGAIPLLAQQLRQLSARGYDAYYACSAYDGIPIQVMHDGKPELKYRTAEQVVATKSLWLDLDCGPDKPYPDADSAIADLHAWRQEYGLPEPSIIYSGGGAHVYWTLAEPLNPVDWKHLALRLKAFCAQTELPADEARTADIASILRPPETLNYKRGQPAPVRISHLAPVCDLASFAAPLPEIESSVRIARSPQSVPDKFTNIYVDAPASATRIAAECRWVREVGQIAKGNVIEPLWYALLGLVIFTEDGDDIGHIWSWGHPEYDYDATEAKLEQARRQQSGPTTCGRFESLWREGCAGCPHKGKITTPLQLGRPRLTTREALTLLPGAATAEMPSAEFFGVRADSQRSGVIAPSVPAAPPLLELPYYWGPDGSLMQSRYDAEKDEIVIKELYRYPILVDAIRRGEISGIAHVVMSHWAPHDRWRQVNIPAGDLTAEGSYRLLGNQHVEVSPSVYRDFTLFLSSAKQLFKENRSTDIQHETFGWKEGGFLLGDQLLGPYGASQAGISEELRKYAVKLRPAGALTAWSAAAQQLFQPGYEHQAVAVLAGLASTLMRWAPYPGAIYSMVSEKSGRGKTFAVEAATSIWGCDQVLWISHRDDKVSAGDTIKAQYRVMALLKSLPIIVDELRDSDPERLRGFILAFTDGSPRKGLNRDGSLRDQFGQWQTIMQVTSNKSIVDIVTVSNDPAAANRVFEVTATLPDGAQPAVAQAIRDGMIRNHGHAGVAFVQALLEPATQAWAQARVAELVARYTVDLAQARVDKGGGDRYIASFLACCVTAAEIANRIGLFQCDPAHILAWAYDRWGRQSGQIEQAHRSPVESLSAFLREHAANTMVVVKETHGREQAVVSGELLRAPLLARVARDTGRLLMDRAAFQRWCLKENLHFLGIADALAAQGILLDRNVSRNLGAGTDFARVGQSRLWLIDSFHPAMSGELREVILARLNGSLDTAPNAAQVANDSQKKA